MAGRRTRSTLLVRATFALIATMLIGTIVGVVASSDGSSNDAATTTSTAPTLDDEGEQLVALLRRRDDRTYHARYEGNSGEDESAVRIETWQQPPLVRQDATVTVEGQEARTSSFVLEDGAVRCTALGDAPMACRQAAPNELGDVDPASAIISRLSGADVTARGSVVDGRPVQCFTLEAAGTSTELCVDDDGIPVLVHGVGSELRLVSLDDEIADGTFEPPAEVQE